MLKLDEVFNGIHFNVSFEDKVNLFDGNSGEGKTFMFKMIKTYLKVKGVSCFYICSEMFDFPLETIKSICRGKSVVIFDNADLYLTQDLLDSVVKTADTIIINMKNPYNLVMSDVGFYSLNYDTDSLCTNRESFYKG